MSVALIIVIALLAGFTLIGAKRGFVSVLIGLLSLVIAIVGAKILSVPLSNFLIENVKIEEKIEAGISSFVNDEVKRTVDNIQETMNIKDVSLKDFKEHIDEMSLPESVKDIIRKATETKQQADTNVTEVLTQTALKDAVHELSTTVVEVLSFVICFIVILVALIILRVSLKIVTKLPVIHQLNGALGAAVGFAEGVIAVWVFFAIITAMANQQWAQDFLIQIADNKLLSVLYTLNPIMKFI